MSWLTLAWLLSQPPHAPAIDPFILHLVPEEEPDPRPWRLIDTPDWHLGVRGHADDGEGAITVQLTATAISL